MRLRHNYFADTRTCYPLAQQTSPHDFRRGYKSSPSRPKQLCPFGSTTSTARYLSASIGCRENFSHLASTRLTSMRPNPTPAARRRKAASRASASRPLKISRGKIHRCISSPGTNLLREDYSAHSQKPNMPSQPIGVSYPTKSSSNQAHGLHPRAGSARL